MSENVELEYLSGSNQTEITVHVEKNGELVSICPSAVRVYSNNWVECRDVSHESLGEMNEKLVFPPASVDHIEIEETSYKEAFAPEPATQ